MRHARPAGARETARRPLAAFLACALVLSFFAASAAATAAATDALPKGLTKIGTVEGIHEYRLDNGMKVLLFPDKSKDTTTVNVTYFVGSRHEGLGETGMAHLLEHLVFKGTPKHPDIPQEMTSRGCRSNGTTWYDRTNYFETFAASDDNLEWALDLESDRMVNSFIAKKDLDSEMTVVRNEFEMGENSPQGVLMERVLSAMYLWHNYGKTTIGSRADIERVPIENLQAFYRKWYQPDNAMLVIGGRFDEAKALKLVAEKFGAIPKPARVLPSTWTEEPAQDGERSVTLKRVGDAQQVLAAYHIPAGSHPDFAAVEVLSYVLGDTPSGRLYEKLVKTGKASGTWSWAAQLHDPGFIIFGADVRRDDDVHAAKAALLEVVEGAGAKAPTAEEISRAKQALLKGWEMSMRNSTSAAIELSEWASMGDWRLMFLHRDRLEKVTADDVHRVARAYLREPNRTTGVYQPVDAPERAPVPARPDVASMLEGYQGREAMKQGEEFDPSPEAIEARLIRKTLPSGLKLVMLPKQTRDGVVTTVVQLNIGNEKALQNQGGPAAMAGSLLMRGTTKRTRQQVEDEIDRLEATLFAYGGASSAGGRVQTVREHLDPALKLLAEILREPAFLASEFELVKQEQLLGLEDARRDPQQIAQTALSKHLDPWPVGDPRRALSVDEMIERLQKTTLEQAKAFHRDFYGATSGQVAIVGDFDPAEVEKLLASLFDGWKAKVEYQRLEDPYREVKALAMRIEVPDKESAVFASALPFRMTDSHEDYPEMALAGHMTGGGFLNSRLARRLRQKDGLCYGVGAWMGVPALDDSASLGGWAIYAPQNADKLEAGFREEIGRVVTGGFEKTEMEEARNGWLQQRKVSRANDGELVGKLAGLEYLGRTLAFDAQVEEAVRALTVEDVNAAVKRHVDPSKMSTVMAGSFGIPPKAGTPVAAETSGQD